MTDSLHLVRLPIDLRQLWQVDAQRGWSGDRSPDEGRALHHALCETFGAGVLQPFRLQVATQNGAAFVYAYTAQSADDLREAAALCGPEFDRLFALDRLEAKDFPTTFPQGKRLGFDVLVRAVRRTKLDSDRAGRRGERKGKTREMDAFVHEAFSRFPEGQQQRGSDRSGGESMAAAGRTREAVYRDWLAERLLPAASFCDPGRVRLARFQRTRRARGGAETEGPDAVLQGDLIVQDTQAFAQLIRHGVGRHKAYGYGMLLLRPPTRPTGPD